MRKFTIMFIALFLSAAAFAGPEEVNMTVDFSYCQNEDIDIQLGCEHYDYASDTVIQCQFTRLRTDKTIKAHLSGDTYFEIIGNCNGHKAHCLYHFKPSKMRNVIYPSEIVTQFPHGQNITVPLITEQLPILKVECR